MNTILLKRIFLCIASIGAGTLLVAQNVVPNYSFDTLTVCPSYYGQGAPLDAPPWDGPTAATPDIFNVCATNPIVGVPNNFAGTQLPLTGEGYGGIICHLPSYEYREYMMAELIQPLAGHQWYHVSFYVSLGEEMNCGLEKIGAYFSQSAPYGWYVGAMDVAPQIESNQGFISDENGWTLISGCFQAQGGERFITIGAFHSDADTPLDPNCTGEQTYYYLENITVIAAGQPDELPLELGDPVTTCPPYVIDPDLSGYQYTWEDGSHDPTLEVNESGIYALTITDENCNYGIDSVEITILNSLDPIDIGPPQLSICEGEEYTVSLDPSLSVYTWQDGAHDAEYTITSSGTYSVTLDDGCSSVTDQIVIDVNTPPGIIFLGDDMVLCQGDEVTFNFDPSIGNFLWQDNSTAWIYTATTGGTYSVTVTNMCGSDSDEIVLTDLEPPMIDIGPDEQTVCEGETINILLDPDAGDILWQDGSTASAYEITTPGIYAVTVPNECGSAIDQMNILLLNPPVTDLGDDLEVCEGDTIHLTNADNNGLYLWQDNSIDEEFPVTNSGTYSLTITNDCGSSSDAIEVNYTSNVLPPNLGPDVSLCPGEQVVLHANSPGAGYLWQDFSTEEYLIVTTAGTYIVDAFNDCSLLSDTIEVTVNNNPPQVDLPDQLSICQGGNIILDPSVTGVTYLWNDNSQNQQLQVNAPGTYSVTVTNSCGSDVDTTIVSDGGLAPSVALGNDVGLCPGDTIVISPVFSNVTSWLWQDGSVSPTYMITNAGAVHVAVSNSCGTAYDTLVTNLLAAIPPLDLGADTSLCPGESFTLTISEPGVNILWSDGSSNPDLQVNGPGLITAIISNSCGQSFDTLIAYALPAIPNLNLGTDQSLCPGEVITIGPGIPNVTYLWHDGTALDSFQTTQQETIILTISNSCGSATDTLEVFESTQGPQVDLGQDIQTCEGDVVLIPSGISGVTYLWQDGSTDSDFMTTLSGQFILQVSNNCGTDADTILVDISGVPPTPSLGVDTTLCDGSTLALNSTAAAGTSIEWQDGSGSSSFIVTSSGLYTLLESNHCGVKIDTILVTYLDAPAPFSFGPDTTLCDGETLNLDAPITSFDIQWQDGTATTTYLISTAGLYSLSITNQCGTETDDILVTYLDAPVSFSLGSDTTLCAGEIYTLHAPVNSSDILWQDGSASPSYDVNGPGTFYVTASNSCGEAADTIHVDFVDTPLPFSLGPDTTLCPGETILLSSPSIFFDVQWQDGSGMLHLLVNKPGTYSLQLSNDCGVVRDEIEVSYDTHIPQFNLDASIPWCTGDIITLDATQSFAAAYIWSTGVTTPSVEITAPGNYNVEVTVPCSTSTQEVEVYPDTDCFVIDVHTQVYIPNVFSPDGDGINDVFAMSFGSDLEVTAMTGSIFDRWGNLVYSSEAIPFQWDGLYANDEVLPGVYVYHIKCTYLEGSIEKEEVFAGDVTVVR